MRFLLVKRLSREIALKTVPGINGKVSPCLLSATVCMQQCFKIKENIRVNKSVRNFKLRTNSFYNQPLGRTSNLHRLWRSSLPYLRW